MFLEYDIITITQHVSITRCRRNQKKLNVVTYQLHVALFVGRNVLTTVRRTREREKKRKLMEPTLFRDFCGVAAPTTHAHL